MSSVIDKSFPGNQNDDNVTDLSSLFDEAADQPPPSIESVTQTDLIGLQQGDPDLKDLFNLVDREKHPYSLRSRDLIRAWRDKLSRQEAVTRMPKSSQITRS